MSRTYFFWDPLSDNILQERDESGTVTAEYTTEPGLYGNLISQNRGEVERQYHFDPQGSTLALTDDSQQVTDTYAYTAHGEVIEHFGVTVNPFQYFGQKEYYLDADTGGYEIRRRDFDEVKARWLSADPVSIMSEYLYAYNSPTRYDDPSGLEVPVYTDTDYTACLAFLSSAIGGALKIYPCSAELLRQFLFENMKGKVVCPKECTKSLSEQAIDWVVPAMSNLATGELQHFSSCGRSGRIGNLSTREGSYCFEGKTDLFYAFHCATVFQFDGACSWACGASQNRCCACNAKCGASLGISDYYDFCDSFRINAGPSLGHQLAKCGCIVEDWRKKHGKDPNTFKIKCNIGVRSQLSFGYDKCYPSDTRSPFDYIFLGQCYSGGGPYPV